ncbi:MAG: isoleucine--tRNA ligase [Patescibacteria group bacterium]
MPYNANEEEKKILEFWQENHTFEKSIENRPENKPYVFYDGPPFATGLPHYGHILSSVIKDVVPRYATMKGYRVRRRWGWDCHGLPIESLIEKELKISGKKQIEEMGVGGFNEACRSKVLLYTQEWKKMVDRIGRWVEFDNAYKTMDPTYMESVWWALKTIWDKGDIYEGRKVLMYCPRCETPVSKAEVTMDNSYKDVTEESVFVKFEIRNPKSEINSKFKIPNDAKIYLLAWTTTPWTLPGNVALAVGSEIEYTVAKYEDAYYIVAKERFMSLFGGKEFVVIAQVFGKDLAGLEYEPLFDIPAMRETGKRGYYVAAADFVTTNEGTGIVHTAVIYGEDDYNLGLKLDLPMVPMLDSKGHYTDVAPEFIRGKYIKQAEKEIKNDLEARGLLFARLQTTHSYPHCWRCETPLIYNAISAWFIDVQKVKPRLLELNEKINWYPEHLKHGRFQNILETAPDWNISRNRYWATPLPFWKCRNMRTAKNTKLRNDDCGNVVCIGSVAELKEKAVNFDEVYKTDKVEEMDLHKQYMDQIRLRCENCGDEMRRIPEVIDCWVEAASMPFAEWHYPFQNKATFHKRFPGQYIAEYIAQTRAWFYYMHVMAAHLFNNVSFENVVTTGTILNDKGEKLSKSKKNFTDPWIIIEQYGIDALRYYLMTSVVMEADNLFFSDREVRDVYNKVINILWNVVTFYLTYSETGNLKLETREPNHVLDKWILAKLNVLVREVTEGMDGYNTVKAGRPIKDFIDDLSTWYLRRSRERPKGDNEADKQAALATLHEVLLTLAKVMAPFTPFMAEKIYQELGGGKESVHLEDWPSVDEKMIDNKVIGDMALARKVVEMGLALRAEAGIKVRQPLGQFSIFNFQFSNELKKIIADELNVKEIVDAGKLTKKGWIMKEDSGITVMLNTTLTDELKKEGLLREIVRTINQMRKDAGLTVQDRVTIQYDTEDAVLGEVLRDFSEELKKATLADQIQKMPKNGQKMVVDEREITLKIEKNG